MMISRKALPRRAMLRGAGAAIALPLLDGMVPALTALRRTAASPTPRLGVVYLPNGMELGRWTPRTEGPGFTFTPILKPLTAYADRLLVLSGFANKEADSLPGEGAGDHSRAQAVFLTGVHPKKTEGPDIRAGVSMDQIAARELSRHTQLASLELAMESNEMVGSCDLGYSCAYSGTIAWRSETTPLPMETDPRAVFERLFGASDNTDARARLARLRKNSSILDSVAENIAQLRKELGPGDGVKLTEYVEAVRDIERRIQKAEEQSARELPVVQQPPGVPATFEAHARLMFDLMALAYQADLTRVATFLMGREISNRTYPEIGVPEPHHPVSHHQDRPEQLDKLSRINIFHMQMFAHLVDKLGATPDGDGSLLDHSVLLYGGGIGNSNLHWHKDLPILVAGGGAGRVRTGRHVRVPESTPLTNLHLTLLDTIGIATERLGDSTGKVDLSTL